ncbi:MAG: BON domain-containing protein, partial [Nitrospiraceae bacterium]
VARVRNLLQVRMKQPLNDEDLAERARTALALTPYVDAYQVRVSVTDGAVLLTGIVDSYFERLRAEYAVFPVEGVTNVINDLQVQRARNQDKKIGPPDPGGDRAG